MRPMGMQEGAILDDQLTASSSIPGYESYRARPDDVGWCANAEDTNPYLQVKTKLCIGQPIVCVYFKGTKLEFSK